MRKTTFTLALAACVAQQAFGVQRPHIILIMTDQQRSDALGCMGNAAVISPNIDRLAAEGTTFMSAYTSCPSSTPARAGLLTGLSPWHHGLLGYGKISEHTRHELPAMLGDAGYFTFAIGKNHFHPQRNRHGYSNVLLDESGRVEDKNFISDYRLWFQLHDPSGNPDATGVGWNDHLGKAYALRADLHPNHWTGEMARTLIANYDNKEKPLFLKVSFARPHSPYDPPKKYLDMYDGKDIPVPAVGDWCGAHSKPLDPDKAPKDAAYGNFGDEYAKNSRRHYYANITYIDDEIGQIVQVLKDKGMYDNSLIVFVSDHGDMLGDHYHWRKTYPYEGSSHVPLVVKWPKQMGVGGGQRVDNVVELRDIMPTFLEAAGADIPGDIDGRSMVQLAKGDATGWRKYIDMEHATCYSEDNYWAALTDGKIKYVWNFHNGSEQLFDLVRDPHELHNAAADRKYRKTLAALRQAMVEHLSERGEGFVKDGKLVVRQKTMLYGPNYKRD